MADPPLFLDTAYIYALINPNDQWHVQASNWRSKVAEAGHSLITTQFVLAEIADGLSAVRFRQAAADIVRKLIDGPQVEVVAASDHLFTAGLELYESRLDKDWGLTDCSSFVTMRERGLKDALTADEHFRQAGFNALLLNR